MPTLELKPSPKFVQPYYAALAQFARHHVTRETSVRQPFRDLLRAAAGPRRLTVEAECPNSSAQSPRIPFVAADMRRLTSKPDANPAQEDGASSRRLLQDAEVFHAFAAAGQRLADSATRATTFSFASGEPKVRLHP